MKKIVFSSLLFLLAFSTLTFPQEKEYTSEWWDEFSFSPEAGFEYFIRTITSDKKEASTLKSAILYLQGNLEMSDRLSLNLIFGGISSQYDGTTFRELPISVKLTKKSGNLYGLIFGGGINFIFTEYDDFEIGAFGQFFYCLGLKKEWDILEFNVSGKVNGKPNWMRIIIGPMAIYDGFEQSQPYGGILFDYISGKFTMEEEIITLQGEEKKKFHSQYYISLLLGNKFELFDNLKIKAEIKIIPTAEKLNIDFVTGITYLF
ncbi:MAG: hypothetical protein ACE5WD_04125 [Candidatus Aminicenantia bacterium]